MDQWINKTAVVTGASSGIGATISKLLVEKGVNVVGLARRVNRMEDMKKQWQACSGTFYPIQCDLRNEDEILKAFEWIAQNLNGVDILINNPGLIVNKPLIRGKTESYRQIVAVNNIAVAICTREAVKVMSDRNVLGHIINMNSIFGQWPWTGSRYITGFYNASKHALLSMTETFQFEIDKENLNIKNLSPGTVKTELAETVGHSEIYEILPYIEPEDVANAVIYVLSTPPNVVVVELTIVPLHQDRLKVTTSA